MERDFYYFLETVDHTRKLSEPYRIDEYLGEIGDVIDLDGELYIIVDYAIDIY